MIGVAPVLGRDFRASEDVFNGPSVVILSDSLWQRLFHRDPAILGCAVQLDGDPYTVVGVMPHMRLKTFCRLPPKSGRLCNMTTANSPPASIPGSGAIICRWPDV